jgi:ribosomal small subunit protein bTHX
LWHPQITKERSMGKGDKKSTRGKIWRSSYGNTRPHRSAKKKSATPAISGARKNKKK